MGSGGYGIGGRVRKKKGLWTWKLMAVESDMMVAGGGGCCGWWLRSRVWGFRV